MELGSVQISWSIGPDRTHWMLLRELASAIMKLLSVIIERLWWLEEVPYAWRKANVTAVIRTGKNEELQSHQLHTSLQESDSPGSHERYFKAPKNLARMDCSGANCA